MAILFPRLPFFNLSPLPAKECPSVSLLLLFGELPKQTGPLNLSFRTAPQGFGSAGSGTKAQDDVALFKELVALGCWYQGCEAGSERRRGEVLAAGGEGSLLGLPPVCRGSSQTPLSLNPPRWAGQLQLHRLAEHRENRGREASNERTMVFL